MTDLLPCPFCGGDAERIDFETVGTAIGKDPNAGGSCISCKKCGASSPVHFDRKENLYSSWNERSPTAEERDHEWFTYGRLNWECCRVCGIVRRKDGKNSPCKGPVSVGPRG